MCGTRHRAVETRLWTAPTQLLSTRHAPLVDVIRPAQVLVRVSGCVLSHEVAAEAWGLDLHDSPGLRRITVPRDWSHVTVPGWTVVRRDLEEDEVELLPDGLRVTAVATTVAGLASTASRTCAVVAADSAMRKRLVTGALLRDVLAARRGPHPLLRRTVAALVDGASGSVLETLLRLLLHDAGIAPPLTQLQVTESVRVDFAWPLQRLIVEADGFEFHADRQAYRRDRGRMNELEQLGWRVLRFTWEDVVGRPEHVAGMVRSMLTVAA